MEIVTDFSKVSKWKQFKSKVKTYVKEHKGEIIFVGVLGVLTALGVVYIRSHPQTAEELEDLGVPELETEPDYSRDIDMQFVDPESGEILGTIPCTENYAREMIDDFI